MERKILKYTFASIFSISAILFSIAAIYEGVAGIEWLFYSLLAAVASFVWAVYN